MRKKLFATILLAASICVSGCSGNANQQSESTSSASSSESVVSSSVQTESSDSDEASSSESDKEMNDEWITESMGDVTYRVNSSWQKDAQDENYVRYYPNGINDTTGGMIMINNTPSDHSEGYTEDTLNSLLDTFCLGLSGSLPEKRGNLQNGTPTAYCSYSDENGYYYLCIFMTKNANFVIGGSMPDNTYTEVIANIDSVISSVEIDPNAKLEITEESASESTNDTATNATSAQLQAVKKAQEYLDYTSFSRQSLIDQLVFEGFSTEDATFGVDNCGANWDTENASGMTGSQQNALDQALSYLDFTAFSYSGLVNQLVFEGYSNEDATFAVDNCGADWNEQARKKAEEYLNYTSFSHSGLVDQLIFEGFSAEQAEYGVSAVGI